MYGRRDQVDAHSFLVGRLVAAVLRVEPDAPDRPLRRTSVGMLGGIAIALLVVAVIVIIDLFTDLGEQDAWREPGTLVVAEESGNRYLMVDGLLRPVHNYSSARLLVGGDPPVETVDTADLDDVPKGSPIGILGAPDQLPSASTAPQPWTVCAGGGEDGPAVAVTVGDLPGVRLARPEEALLVRAGDERYLAWRGSRSRITADWVPRALGLDPAAAVPVDSAWLNSLPAGPDLGQAPLARTGAGPVIDGYPTTAGQLVAVPEAVGDNLFAAARGGLIPVTPAVAALLRSDPGVVQPPQLTTTPAELANQKVLPAPVWQAELPPRPPTPVDTGTQAACVRWDGKEAMLAVAPPPVGPGQSGDQAAFTRDGRVADRIEVAPGAGLLARTRPAPDVPGAGSYLITEAGAKFPVLSSEAADALGFSVKSARLVPAELLALLPTGPALDVIE
ncbi:type VII secretion protein EccB [Actinophytocola sediminis]